MGPTMPLTRRALLPFASLAIVLAGCTDQAAAPAGGRIAVIPKGTTHVFWKAVERGARAAAGEHGVTIDWKGPLKEDDRAQQIQLVQQFVAQGARAIALAPLDRKALAGPVREAAARGIPVAIFDSALEGEPGKDFLTFVATDNAEAGRLGGETLAGLLGGRGKVVLLRYQVGSASTDAREQGFLDAVRAHPSIEVTVDNRYAGATLDEAKTAALNMADKLRAADGVFCVNESTTHGMLLALRHEGLAGKVKFVGFDGSPALVAGLEGGEVDALVVQNPHKMGFEAVRLLADHLAGKPVPAVADTGVAVVRRADLASPAVRELLR
jgi:ribose transport system substrate-binding protein